MSTIKELEKLSGILEEHLLKKVDAAAKVHKKQSNIEFTIIDVADNVITVETEQGETSGNYARLRTLIQRTGEVFDKYLPSDVKLNIIPKEYVESPAAVVTPEWIERKMKEIEVRIKQIAFDTGLDRKDISGWVTGERKMSQIVKAMFFFYFERL